MEVLEQRFATIGARVKIPAGPRRGMPAIDVGDDRLRVDEWAVLRDEPISRGQGSAPHVLEPGS